MGRVRDFVGLWCALAAVALTGCGDEADSAAAEAPALSSISLEVRGAEAWPPLAVTSGASELARAVPCLPGGHTQVAEALSGLTLEPTRDQTPGVRLVPTGGAAYLRVPLPAGADGSPARNVDLVRVRARVPGFARFFGILGYRLPWRAYTASAALAGERGVAEIELPVLTSRAHGHDLDSVTLLVQGASAPLEILSVEAVTLADPERLPEPGLGVFATVGNESRPSHGLLPGADLSCSLPGWSEGAITVGFAVPEVLPLVEGAEAMARLMAGNRVVAEKRVALAPGWTDLELPIGADTPTELRLSTTSPRGVLCSTPRWRGAPKSAPRTVLLITSDTHRADHVGFAGRGVQVDTPAMDALAERGLVFDQARSVSSTTNPSHASILTGLSPRDTGIHGNLTVLSERANTLAEEFQRAGFRTFASTSARHLAPRRSGFGQGFERFAAPPFELAHDGSVSLESALSMLEDAEGDDVFLWLHFFDVHGPYRKHVGVTEPYYDRLKKDPFLEKYAELPPEKRMPWERKVADARYALALYSGEVTYTDGLLGRAFESAPRLRDGWVALTADHGESLGEQGLWWEHNRLYPSTLDVPLVIAGPGVPAGRSARPVSNASVGATLLALAGVGNGGMLPGERLDRVGLDGAEGADPHWVVGLAGNSAGVFLDGWYLLLNVRFKGKKREPYHPSELYHLAVDPKCEVDVSERHPERAARMRQRLVSYLADVQEGGALRVREGAASRADRADMIALGYGGATGEDSEDVIVDPSCGCMFCAGARDLLSR